MAPTLPGANLQRRSAAAPSYPRAMAEDVTALLADLVRIDSVNPELDPAHRGEGELARFVATWAGGRDLQVDWLERTPGRPSVIVTARGSGGGRNLLLNAHLDTVGVAGMTEPFTPVVKDGRMFGRGVMDMKASLAACLITLTTAQERGLEGDVILTAVADEEHGSLGTREALDHIAAAGTVIDAAIITEPTDLELHVAHRGFSVVEVTFAGKASHTSQPEAGVNAVTHLGRMLAAVDAHARSLLGSNPHPLLAFGSLQPVLVHGGRELFTTPAEATLTLERRTLPGETAAFVVEELQSLLDQLSRHDPSVNAELRTVVAREPFEAPLGSELELILAEAITAVHGTPPMRLGAPYWTDAALVAASGVPTLLFGPVGGAIHQPGEWLDVASVTTVQGVLERVATNFCGGGA